MSFRVLRSVRDKYLRDDRVSPDVSTGIVHMTPGPRVKPKSVISLVDFYPSLERGEIKPGTVLIFRYQGPKGAPGMPEVRYLVYLLCI